MGIRGLNSFFDRNPDFSKPYKLHDTKVIFDGDNLLNFLYFNYEVPCTYGGDYDRYAGVVERYFSSYLKCNIVPIVIFDGGHDKTDKKLQRLIERRNQRLELVGRISNNESYSEQLLPIFAYDVFIDVIKKLNIAYAQSSFEADGPVTSIANYYRCPVISSDSDFYIFDITSGFIRSDCVDMIVRVGTTKSGRQCRYLSCKIYTIDHFLSFFPPVHKRFLPLFGTLLGNDFVDASTFDNFFQSDEFPEVKSNKSKLSARHKNILGLLFWLKSYDRVDDANEDVFLYVPEELRQSVRDLVQQALDSYKVCKPYLVKYIDPVAAVSGICSSAAAETLLTFDGNPLPAWFVNDFHKANISSYIINVVGLRRMTLPIQVEDTRLSSSCICSLTIRQVLYGLLVSLDDISKDGAREIYVEEFDRLGTKLQKNKVKPVMVLEGFGPLPNLSRRQLNTKQGKFLISCALREQNTRMNDLPDFLQLLVMSIRYWLRISSPEPTAGFFDALLLTILYLHIAEPQSSAVKNVSTNECKRFSPGQYETASILDVLNDVLPKEAAQLWRNFQTYCRRPSHDPAHPVDISTIHSFSQLQGCLFFMVMINKFVGQPFSTPKMQCTFSGSLIYNVTLQLRTQRSPETFIAQTLGPSPALKYLFKKLKNKILENLPDHCLRESGLFGAYPRRKET